MWEEIASLHTHHGEVAPEVRVLKLTEEVAEFLDSDSDPEELADVLEVVHALAALTAPTRSSWRSCGRPRPTSAADSRTGLSGQRTSPQRPQEHSAYGLPEATLSVNACHSRCKCKRTGHLHVHPPGWQMRAPDEQNSACYVTVRSIVSRDHGATVVCAISAAGTTAADQRVRRQGDR
jgi:hypothetical protein